MYWKFDNCYPLRFPAATFLTEPSYKSLTDFRFQLLQSTRQRKPEVALDFAFDRCELFRAFSLYKRNFSIKHAWDQKVWQNLTSCRSTILNYSRTPLFRSPKGNGKKFEIAGFRNNPGSVKGKGKSKGIRSSFEIAGTSN